MAEVLARGGAGALAGPRVLGRLTAELVLRSPQYMNCCGDYEIDMRANRITAIENLGTTEVGLGGRAALRAGGLRRQQSRLRGAAPRYLGLDRSAAAAPPCLRAACRTSLTA